MGEGGGGGGGGVGGGGGGGGGGIDEVAARQGWLMFSVEVRWENERHRTYIILRGMGRRVVSKMEEVSTFIIIELFGRRQREYLSFVPPPSLLFFFIHSNPIVHGNIPISTSDFLHH